MIRKFTFLKRATGLTRDAFCDQWTGSAGAAVSQEDHLTRYVQNLFASAIDGITPDPIWDGLEQVEYGDIVYDMAATRDFARNTIAGVEGAGFVDQTQIVQFVAREHVVLGGPERGVKILSLPRRRAGLSPAQFSRHYREVHGMLVARNAAFTKYANRYVQHHVFADTVRNSDGFTPYDGISEFWFDSLDHATKAWSAPSYMAELRADEKNFVGSPPSHRGLVDEVTVLVP